MENSSMGLHRPSPSQDCFGDSCSLPFQVTQGLLAAACLALKGGDGEQQAKGSPGSGHNFAGLSPTDHLSGFSLWTGEVPF